MSELGRRTFLAACGALAGALAGCATDSGTSTDRATDTGTPTDRATDTRTPRGSTRATVSPTATEPATTSPPPTETEDQNVFDNDKDISDLGLDHAAPFYESLVDRITPRGYAPTSTGGNYPDMYVRDAAVQVLSHLAAGDDDHARAILSFLLRYSLAAGVDRLPHWVPDPRGERRGEDPAVAGELATLGGPDAAIVQNPPDLASERIVSGVDVHLGLTENVSGGAVDVEIRDGPGPDAGTLAAGTIPATDLPESPDWVSVPLPPPWPTDGAYHVRLSAPDLPDGSVVLSATEGTYGTTYDGRGAELDRTAAARFLTAAPDPDMADQPDGHYHYVLAWARYAREHPEDPFVDRTFPMVADYADYYFERTHEGDPYFDSDRRLLLNPAYEHARQTRFWVAYDLLTNTFASQALHELAAVAESQGKGSLAATWRDRSEQLAAGVHENLTATVNGKPTYAEMIAVDEGGAFYDGFSYVNLAPVACEWYAVQPERMANTYRAYRDCCTTTYNSEFPLLNIVDDKRLVAGKLLAWDLRHAANVGDRDRVMTLVEFAHRFGGDESLYEGWTYSYGNADGYNEGNQEQVAWYTYHVQKAFPGESL